MNTTSKCDKSRRGSGNKEKELADRIMAKRVMAEGIMLRTAFPNPEGPGAVLGGTAKRSSSKNSNKVCSEVCSAGGSRSVVKGLIGHTAKWDGD